VLDKASQLGEDAVDATRKAIDAHSPSRKFAELGRMSALGYVEGIEAGQGAVDDIMRGAFAVPAPQAGGGALAGLGAPKVSIVVDLSGMHVQAGAGTNGNEIGESVAQQVRSILPGAILNAFERIRSEHGAGE
jgi:hypothetical protein